MCAGSRVSVPRAGRSTKELLALPALETAVTTPRAAWAAVFTRMTDSFAGVPSAEPEVPPPPGQYQDDEAATGGTDAGIAPARAADGLFWVRSRPLPGFARAMRFAATEIPTNASTIARRGSARRSRGWADRATRLSGRAARFRGSTGRLRGWRGSAGLSVWFVLSIPSVPLISVSLPRLRVGTTGAVQKHGTSIAWVSNPL